MKEIPPWVSKICFRNENADRRTTERTDIPDTNFVKRGIQIKSKKKLPNQPKTPQNKLFFSFILILFYNIFFILSYFFISHKYNIWFLNTRHLQQQ